MNTPDKFEFLHMHAARKLENAAEYRIESSQIERDFGIAPPFWPELSQWVELFNPAYTIHRGWTSGDGGVFSVTYRQKTQPPGTQPAAK